MTVEELALLVKAERRGSNYVAGCPAHKDRRPSLSFKAGDDGRVLVRCWAGCSTDAVLSALKLSWLDLFAGPPPSPEQLMVMRAQRKAKEFARWQARAGRNRAYDRSQRAQTVVSVLAAKLLDALYDRLYKQGHFVVLSAGKNFLFDELFLFEGASNARAFYESGYSDFESFLEGDDEGYGFQEVSLYRAGRRIVSKSCAPTRRTERKGPECRIFRVGRTLF